MRRDAARALRVGAVPFVNARPLVRRLDPADPPPLDLILEPPSILTEMMRDGTLEAALLPSIEYFRHGAYRIIPHISISSDGTVETVRVFSTTRIEDIRLLALDESSRTSATLVKILLKRKLGALPDFVNCSPDAGLDEIEADAMLLIGDAAMTFRASEAKATLDLGEEWKKLTGLPFVYAMWVVREGVEAGPLGEKLQRARDRGMADLRRISEEAGRDTGLSAEVCFNYLKDIMRYNLGEHEIEALRLFQKLAAEDGLCPGGVGIEFVGQ